MTGQAVYAATKAGLIGFSLSLAKELGRKRITVNCLAPGLISSPMTDNLEAPEDRILLGRKGTPEEVADSVLHLLTSPYITGSVLSIDGGLKL